MHTLQYDRTVAPNLAWASRRSRRSFPAGRQWAIGRRRAALLVSGSVRVVSVLVVVSIAVVSRGLTLVDGPAARGDVAQPAAMANVMTVTIGSRFMSRSGRGASYG